MSEYKYKPTEYKLLNLEGLSTGKSYKFVRVGNSIAYGDALGNHKNIALLTNLSTVKNPYDIGEKPEVDDAGIIEQNGDGIIEVSDTSFSCKIVGDRAETLAIIKAITDKETIGS